ncbi:hypothetical protein M8C13_00020 [Crossiella sp. SN42]|uniref:hypothetical protein n=1 Tax=Crossiella sp. SN42 TaxID=2944808 RepID=UPI00207D3EF6|nr:hypothetical protein [Crossiella sp. SN42]MCO1574143.1 hypothetical protein [Crossiella sp. SN42]
MTVLLHPVDKVIRVHNSSARVNLSIDLLGYYSSGGVSTFFPMPKTTRLHQGFPLEAGGQFALALRGVQGISATATAVAVNVTTLSASEATEVEVFSERRTASWTATPYPGTVTTSSLIVPIGPDNGMKVYNARGKVTVAVDVTGYFDVRSGGGRYVPLRHINHNYSSGNGTGATAFDSGLPAGRAVDITVTGRDGVPAGALGAMLTVSARLASEATTVEVWQREHGNTGWASAATEQLLPMSVSGRPARNNGVLTGLPPSGTLNLSHSKGIAHLRSYIHGYYIGGA